MSRIKLFFIDMEYDSQFNRDVLKKLKSIKYFDLKTFKELKPAIEEIKRLGLEIIFVLIRGKLYEAYYFEIKKLRPTLKCIPISFIFTSASHKNIYLKKTINDRLKKETIDSLGDEYYNKGGVVTTANELIQSIENIFGYEIYPDKIEENLFYFEDVKDDCGNLILACLYSKVQSRDSLINNEEIKDFNYRLKDLHPCKVNAELLDSFLKLQKIPIKNLTEFWIKYFSADNTFYKEMHRQFRENNFINYKTFYKALNRGLEKKYLKSKFDVPLYFGSFFSKDDFDDLEKKIKENKKKLIYSRQILSFTQIKEVSFRFIQDNNDKNYVPVLLEVNILKSLESYTYNVDFDNLSTFPEEKIVPFLPYSCFVIEDKILDCKEKGLKYKLIKLNYLGNYSKKINEKIKGLNKEKIRDLLKRNSKFVNDLKFKFNNEYPQLEEEDLIKLLNTESELIKEKLKHPANYQYPKNTIEIEMEKAGKFLGDDFFKKYHWMLKIYFEDELQEEETNEIKRQKTPKIKIEIDSPIFDCEKMFYLCDNIKIIKFIKFDTSHVTNMYMMFSDCDSLAEVSVDNFDTSNVTNMSCMFYKCSSLKKLRLSKLKTDNVTNMSAMFYLCTSLKNLDFDLSKMNLNKLEDITFMFRCCYSLDEYDLSNFDTSNIKFKDEYI